MASKVVMIIVVVLVGLACAQNPPRRSCHRLLDDAGQPRCEDEDGTFADSCEQAGYLPSLCSASGWPVCCRGQESGALWTGVWWYKAGQKCSDLHTAGGTFAPCHYSTRQ